MLEWVTEEVAETPFLESFKNRTAIWDDLDMVLTEEGGVGQGMKDLSKSHLSLDFLIFLFKVLFTAKARKEQGIHFFFVTESGIPFEFQLKSCRLVHSLLLPSSRPFGDHHFFCYAESSDEMSLPFSLF